MNFNNILIGSENPEALVEYYTKLFGAAPNGVLPPAPETRRSSS